MGTDQPMPVTLDIADCRMDLMVISFKGVDSLNEVYRYDIDLVSTDPHLDAARWSGRDAFLCFGPPECGVHGRICDVSQPYAGTCLSHYRVSLMPSLHLLARRRQRRAHLDIAVPALISRMLEEYGIEPGGFRFDTLVGSYPPQSARVQYDETDLHFLQRTCEEEGIHFRFEHSRGGHVLVFADDPASFPEHLPALHFDPEGGARQGGPMLRHLAQQWSMPVARVGTPIRHQHWASAPSTCPRDEHQGRATNQPFDEPPVERLLRSEADLQRQRRVRDLERLRSDRQRVHGRSDRTDVHSGRIVLVAGHPDSALNDQWLVIGIRHSASQLQVLEGQDPHDIAAIIAGLPTDSSGQVPGATQYGYSNEFDALPWTTTFRPPLRRARPFAGGEQSATVLDGSSDDEGRLPIRFDWEPARRDGRSGLMAHVLRGNQAGLDHLQTGARVLVAHFDGDPERPVICGLLSEPAHLCGMNIHLDGQPVNPATPVLALGAGQRLQVQTTQTLTLHGDKATLELGERWISIRGPRTVHASPWMAEGDGWHAGSDLRLTTQPSLQGTAIANCVWYIVRMAQPGLEYLPRLNPEHILYEGITDEHGYLGLTAQQLKQLAKLFSQAPHALCLIYPGRCVTLQAWFEQNWTLEQRRAFGVSGL
jgi:type VI secretion system secreted protein VgrG